MDFKFDLKNPSSKYVTTTDRAASVLAELEQKKVLAVDTETNSLDPYTGNMFLVQIAKETKCYLFDTRKVDLKALPLFKQILEDKTKVKLLQNGSFRLQIPKSTLRDRNG